MVASLEVTSLFWIRKNWSILPISGSRWYANTKRTIGLMNAMIRSLVSALVCWSNRETVQEARFSENCNRTSSAVRSGVTAGRCHSGMYVKPVVRQNRIMLTNLDSLATAFDAGHNARGSYRIVCARGTLRVS